jgi:2'-5' RNA ligase
MRVFVAADIPAPIRRELAGLRERMPAAPGLRWVRSEGIHLTFRFLGESGRDRVELLRGTLPGPVSLLPPIPVRFERLGTFPPAGLPRVFWAGLAGDLAALSALAACVESAVVACGWDPESRPFHPHVTLARASSPAAGACLRKALSADPAWTREWPGRAMDFVVSELTLFESHLGPGGARYTALGAFPMRAPGERS